MSGPFKMKGNPLKRNFNLKVGKGQGSKRKGKYTETRKLLQPPTHIWDYKKRNEL